MTIRMVTAAQEPPWKTVRPWPRPPDGAGWHRRDGIEVGVIDAGAASGRPIRRAGRSGGERAWWVPVRLTACAMAAAPGWAGMCRGVERDGQADGMSGFGWRQVGTAWRARGSG